VSSTTVRRHRPINETHRRIGDVGSRVLETPGPGAPLVFLHGYSDLADTWRPVMRQLAGGDHHLVAVDLPGFGRADPFRPGPVLPQLDSFVADLVSETYGVTGQPVFVIGNSLGGITALRAGGNRDLPLAGVVPISPAGFGHSRAIKAMEGRDALLPMIERRLVPMPVIRGVTGVAFRRASCRNPRHADRQAVRAFTDQFRRREDMIRVFRSAAPVLGELRAGRDVPLTVECPVMLLWGDRDRLTLHSGASHIQAAIPQAELVSLHGYGHCPQIEIPARVASHISEFVERHSSAS
jgi:pimeloyl-ACP methyl ester carboxylesterase